MKTKKTPFFIRLKQAVINFDEYKYFLEEKISVAIKYILKLVLLFTLIITTALTYKVINVTNSLILNFQNNCPEFSFKNNILTVEGDNKRFVKGDESGYFGIIIDSEKDNLKDIEEIGDYQTVIAVLKDKIIVKNVDGVESNVTYEQLAQNNNLNDINKETILQLTSGNNMMKVYTVFSAIAFLYLYVLYLIQIILDIFLLSLVGYILSRIINIKLKYKSIFNISVYGLSLSVILYMLYILINTFTGFTIKYFEIAYNAIAYIYVITAMMMIKSDLIKQQIEVGKIVEEQKKIEEENGIEKDKPKEEPEKEKKDEKNNKEKENKGQAKGTPEGNEA